MSNNRSYSNKYLGSPKLSRRPTSTPESDYEELTSQDGSKNALKRFKFNLDAIIGKYDRPYRHESDVIDLRTFEIVHDNNHIRQMKDRTPDMLGLSLAMPDPIDPQLCAPGDDYTGNDEPDEGDDVDFSDEQEDSDEYDYCIDQEEHFQAARLTDDDQEKDQQPILENQFKCVSRELFRINSNGLVFSDKNSNTLSEVNHNIERSYISPFIVASKLTKIQTENGRARSASTGDRYGKQEGQSTSSARRLRNEDSMDRLTKLLHQKPLISSPTKTSDKRSK